MKEISYVVVFPNDFSKNKIPQLMENIKKILKIKNQQFNSIKRDGDVILVDANDPVFSSSAINLLFGIKKIAIARQIKNDFQVIVKEIASVGGNLLLKGERFLVRVEGKSKGFFTKDVELSATSAIIEKKSNIDAKPGTDENFDKLLYTYLTKNHGYVCIFIDKGLGGIPFDAKKQDTICCIYDEISAISCYETIKQGYNSKIIVCYRQKSDLINIVKMLNQIIPRLLKQKIEIDFFNLNISNYGTKNYLLLVKSVLDVLIKQTKKTNVRYVSIALSPLIFSRNFIDESMKLIFENNLLPILPLFGINGQIFDDLKEIGIEKNISKIRKIISMKLNESTNHINKIADVVKSKKTVMVDLGPNNMHDILDSFEENH
ncbi:thiamine biosynthesis protein [Nitrosopumilus sp. K4]|uniref:thiamine biosynthesis protein n=1 Tax=Nitrosopumilus sp. K4 TaxID=2795383 RepID=UPI001BA8D6D4|nr:thiamine biosynthesis protein [Nitrosopumilus sp. K4]QUC65738.1 thiamine biosynthesis protein [Nitrosopumilus sp. K4]